MIVQECIYGGESHVWPDDWKFGGADGNDPAADARFQPSTYLFLSEDLDPVFLSGQFRCDDAALDYFTTVCEMYSDVKWVLVKRPGSKHFERLPFVYVPETDTVHPYKSED